MEIGEAKKLGPRVKGCFTKPLNTMWGPQTIAKSIYNSNVTMVYDTITIVFMGFINQQTSLGGPTLYSYIMLYLP